MFRIAMNAPIMAALTAIQAVALALSGEGAAAVAGAGEPSGTFCVMVDIALSCHLLAGETASDRRQLMRSDAEAT
jgi:hypothetical protein